jgi:predicted phage gp36 major capsid-like protein
MTSDDGKGLEQTKLHITAALVEDVNWHDITCERVYTYTYFHLNPMDRVLSTSYVQHNYMYRVSALFVLNIITTYKGRKSTSAQG